MNNKRIPLIFLSLFLLILLNPLSLLAQTNSDPDTNHDGWVDIFDLNTIQQFFGQSSPNTQSQGAYAIMVDNTPTTQITLTCDINDLNCNFYQPVLFQNIATFNGDPTPLYDTTFWTDNPSGLDIVEYQSPTLGWTTEQSTINTVFEPGSGPNILVKATPPATVGTYHASLYIDAKVCNNVSQIATDCNYYGGASLDFTINVVDNSSASPASLTYPSDPATAVGYCLDFNGAPKVTTTFQWNPSSTDINLINSQQIEYHTQPDLSANATIHSLPNSASIFTPPTTGSGEYLLEPNTTYYWRINTQINQSWFPSTTQSFTTTACN